MNEHTKKEFEMQMNRTQDEFDKMRNIFYDKPKISFAASQNTDPLVSYDEGIPMEDVEIIHHKPLSPQDEEPRKQWPATCSSCNKSTTVPFEPKFKSNIYCPECFKDRNGQR